MIHLDLTERGVGRLLAGLALLFSTTTFAQEALFSYQGFTDDLDVSSIAAHDRSRIWSTCAVVHDLMALVDNGGTSSSSAQESKNQSNGAKLASAIVFLAEYIEQEKNPTPDEFSARWEMAKMVMDSNFTTIQTSMMADMERNPDGTLERLVPTYAYCIKILPTQQLYIDLWREMYGSGLLKPQ